MRTLLRLLFSHGLAFIVPLLLLPIFAKGLGSNQFGYFIYIYTFMQYAQLFMEYSFNLDAARRVASNSRKKQRNFIFSLVLTTKFIFLISLIILFLLLITVIKPKFLIFYWMASSLIFYNFFSMQWFYQGVQKLFLFNVINILPRLCSIPVAYFFVKKPTDITIAAAIYSVSFILGAILSFIWIVYKEKLHYKKVKLTYAINYIRKTYHLFFSTIAVSLYTTTNQVCVGFFAGDRALAIFAISEKLIRAVINFNYVIIQYFYPTFVGYQYGERDIHLWKLVGILSIWGSLIFLVIFTTANLIIEGLFGIAFIEAVPVLRILALLPLVIIASNIFGTLGLIPAGKDGPYSFIIITLGLVGLVLIALGSFYGGAEGAAWSVLIIECLIALSFMVIYAKYSRL